MTDKKQERFLSLYEPVHDKFERFCRARSNGIMEVSDLINETLLVAYQKFESIKSDKAFLPFLIGISIRLMANYKRKQREIVDMDKAINNMPSDFKSETQTEIYLLYRAIAQLPDNQKDSIILFEITGFSIKEIADMHQVSESAVKKRLQRGRSRLLELLSDAPLTNHRLTKYDRIK